MKRAFFIRHAKSSWADSTLADTDRPLNGRGKRDAPLMGQRLSEICSTVDLILCSPARRARDTCAFFEDSIHAGQKRIRNKIYHAWPEALVETLNEIEDDIDTVLVFGHNPGFTSVYNQFATEYIPNLPTCGIFELKCTSTWSDLDTTNTSIGHLLYPKMFKD